jgi:hypothetical protein
MFVGENNVTAHMNQILLRINNQTIKRVECMKIPGVMTDSNLQWDKPLSKISQSCNYLSRVGNFLISSLTLSHLHYFRVSGLALPPSIEIPTCG